MTYSKKPGMGAIFIPDEGVTFRVWAPNAEAVYVSGTFNQWKKETMYNENNGLWSRDITSAKPGDEYEFIITNKDDHKDYHRIDPYAKDVTNSVGKSIIVYDDFDWSSDSEYQTPTWDEMVIYEMHLGTFNDTSDDLPGNLETAMKRLKYIKDLGINTIEIMPIAEFAQDYSWGYNPAQIFAVESAYGGPTAFKKFILEAHKHGIAVILDVVYNHFGPSDLDLWCFDGWKADTESDYGGIYFYNDNRAITDWGQTRPDYGRPEVRQYIIDNALMWLGDYHIDGLRLDSTVSIRTSVDGDIEEGWTLMQDINNAIDKVFPWKIMIAEDLQDNEWLIKSTDEDGAGFDAQWASDFVHPIREAIIAADDESRNLWSVKDAITRSYNGDCLERIIYTESHDEVANGSSRVPEEIWPDNADSLYSKKRSILGAILTFTSPGIPMIFQGQELLEDGWFSDTDPLDWSKLEDYKGIQLLYKDLIHLRRNWYSQTRGLRGQHIHVFHVNDLSKVMAYHRWKEGGSSDDVIVIINMSNTFFDTYQIGVPSSGLWKVLFNSDWTGYSDDFGNAPSFDSEAVPEAMDGYEYSIRIGIGAYSGIILSKD